MHAVLQQKTRTFELGAQGSVLQNNAHALEQTIDRKAATGGSRVDAGRPQREASDTFAEILCRFQSTPAKEVERAEAARRVSIQ